MKFMRYSFLVLGLMLLAACGGKKDIHHDGPPDKSIDANKVVVLKPRPEPRARYGNKSPYTVLGKTYTVLPTAEGYHQRGIASWYGKKFHGRTTSSGELYDMYLPTAAHKSLPLPTYAEVTNLDNGRTLIVKINDRGPFHEDRMIDLSYGAAVKLGVIETGTARVEVRTLSFEKDKSHAKGKVNITYQVGAFSDKSTAKAVAKKLEKANINHVEVKKGRTSSGSRVWRVRVGPITNTESAWRIEQKIIELGYGRPNRV